MYPESVNRLIEELRRLPGIGQKTAERLSFHILVTPADEAMRLAYAIRDAKRNVRPCSACSNITEHDPCAICSDASRQHAVICVVEQPKDILSIERLGTYRGVYHVLLGALAPLDGIEPEDLTVRGLVDRVRAGGVREVILATNPTFEGDQTALWLKRVLGATGVRVTRLARGMPSGSTLEFSTKTVLADAMEGRHEVP